MHEYYSASDVWGFAVFLWELFSFGEIPLQEMTTLEIEQKVKAGFTLPQPLHCPGSIYAIMLSCWRNREIERPSFNTIGIKIKAMCGTLKSSREQPSIPTNPSVSYSILEPSKE